VPAQIYFDDVQVGDQLPVLEVDVSRVQAFFFSAATYNGHRIHYDVTWAREGEGYPDIIIQGPLQVALLARTITDWMGADGQLIEYSVQNRGSAYLGEGLRFGGTVSDSIPADDAGLITLDVRGEKRDGTILMPGTATVRLPLRDRR
jgi:acyl dehydratase